MTSSRKSFLAILFLLGLAILFFAPYLVSGKIPYEGDLTGSDLTELNLPLRYLAASQLKAGQIPLWTDLLANGFPLLAEGQAGVFYPFNLILFTFLPFFAAINLAYLINFFLAGAFTYFFGRILKISCLGSLVSAIAFSFSGFFIFRLRHLNYINAAIWLPLEFYLIEKYFLSRRKNLILVFLSLVFGIQFFAGSPPFFYVSIVSAFAYFVFKIFFNYQNRLKANLLEIVYSWVIIGVVIFGLTAIQLFPSFFNSVSAGRGLAMSYLDATSYPYLALSLLFFIFPYFLGNPAVNTYPADVGTFGVFWENNIYFGLLPFCLAVMAMIFLFAKNRPVKILTILALSSFLIIFGDFSPIFVIFWKLFPGLMMFRFPQRFLLLTLLCLVVLAGFGFDFLWEKLNHWRQQSGKLAKSKLLFKFLLPVLIMAVIIFDLGITAIAYVGSLDYNQYFSPPKSAEFLQSDPDIFRIYSIDWPGAWRQINQLSNGWQNNLFLMVSGREMIWPNSNVFWNIASAQDRASLEGGMLAKENQQLGNRLILESWFGRGNENSVGIADQTLKIFGLENVKYFLSFKELKNNNLVLAKKITNPFLPPLKIYRNNYFLPLAFGVFNVQSATSTEAMFSGLFDQNFDPAKTVILADNQSETAAAEKDSIAEVKILERQNSLVKIQADFSHPGYLVLSQSFASGWKATVDGGKAEIVRADYAFGAVKVSAGKHQVIFSYQPLAYSLGKWLTGLTFGLILVYLFFSLIIKPGLNKWKQ